MAREFFNGGGHEDAAGGKLYCSVEEAEQITLRAITAYQQQLGR
jgi:phosphoesterase RecJ-like protein